MREYGQIQCAFWQSDDALNTSDAGKLLAAYLLTGPHSNGIGCYRCPDGYIMADLGWTSERVSEGFEELSRNGFAYRFDGVVCIPNFLRWNKIANGNVAKARMGELVALPKGRAKALAARAIAGFCNFLSDDDQEYLRTVRETVTETVCQTETNPNQPNPDPTQPSSLRSDSDSAPALDLAPPADNVHQHPAGRVCDTVVAVYHELLPKCQGVGVLNPKRKKRIQLADKLAREVCKAQGWQYDTEDFWRAYFGQCAKDPWMRGDVPNPKNGAWKQNLDVLLAEDRFAQVMDQAVSAMRAAA